MGTVQHLNDPTFWAVPETRTTSYSHMSANRITLKLFRVHFHTLYGHRMTRNGWLSSKRKKSSRHGLFRDMGSHTGYIQLTSISVVAYKLLMHDRLYGCTVSYLSTVCAVVSFVASVRLSVFCSASPFGLELSRIRAKGQKRFCHCAVETNCQWKFNAIRPSDSIELIPSLTHRIQNHSGL